ncbi:protein Wnt-4 [Chrysoperla carnea]|uniref:protein Wnt-4 n=1 Tax=Chrysoperla carnea TaxID=189513 RepID=UPI001D062407|nr:protein Wnt-4 [Chrysoperla carnea]
MVIAAWLSVGLRTYVRKHWIHKPRIKGVLRNNPIAAVYLYQDLTSATRKTAPCYWLRASRQQYTQCRREPGLANVLNDSRFLTIQQCEDQFRYDRWNCSHSKNMFKKVYRETAFMHALNAASITTMVSRACAEGKLKKCHCSTKAKKNKIDGDDGNLAENKWKWGGCGDNLQYGRRFVRKFLQLRAHSADFQETILSHNSEVGIRTVASQMRDVCKCHGVSGSCSIKTCWRRVPPLIITATQLKKKYHRAMKFEFGNRATRRAEPTNKKWPKGQLLYLENSSTFCAVTPHRKCLNRMNCATLCCGRGYYTKIVYENRNCNCRWKKKFEMICDQCSFEIEEFTCK